LSHLSFERDRKDLFRKVIAIASTYDWLFRVAPIEHMVPNQSFRRNFLAAADFVEELRRQSAEVVGHKNVFYDPFEDKMWVFSSERDMIHITPLPPVQEPSTGRC